MADTPDKISAFEKRIKKHVIGKPHRFMAVAPLGFEKTLVEELKYFGVECVENGTANGDCTANEDSSDGIKVAGDGKVEFIAKITEAWKAVAYSRIANRVLMEIETFKAENFGQLEKGVAAVPWELFLNNAPITFHTTCKHSRLYHSGAIEERVAPIVAKALNNTVADSFGQNIYINLQDDRCTLWLDLAGEELYKRGHERFVAEAPLKETIAAAMIFEACRLQVPGSRLQASGDNTASATPQSERSEQPRTSSLEPRTFIDPMAGSGTFSLEVAYIANGLIPGKCRDFALKHQPAFKEGTWNYLLKAADSTQCHPERSGAESKDLESTQNILRIITSDISERPISIIKHNAEASPLAEIAKANPNAVTINPQLKDFFSYTIDDICAVRPSANDTAHDIVILLNPPYGKRLAFDAPKLYTKIGQKLTEWNRDTQSRSQGITVAILVPKDCMSNLLQACPTLDPHHNDTVKTIETSHGGFSLNALFAKI